MKKTKIGNFEKNKKLMTSLIRYIILSSLAIAVISASSCRKNNDIRLQRAEMIIDSCPDSAMRILSTIQEMNIENEYEIAKYSLLKMQAYVKLDSIIADTTLISKSIVYFSSKPKTVDYLKSLYYYGWIQYGNGEYYRAMSKVIEAYDLAIDSGYSYWAAKCAELISIIFQANFNFAEANKFSKKASQLYMDCGRVTDARWSVIDQAISYAAMQMHDSALITLDQIPEPVSHSDSLIWGAAAESRLYSLFECGRYEEADSVFNKMEDVPDYIYMGPLSYHTKVILLCNQNRADEAEEYLLKGESISLDLRDKAAMARARMHLNACLNNYKEAFDISNGLLNISDRINRQTFKDFASLAQRDYFNKKAQNYILKAERRKYMILFGGILAMFVLFAVWFLYKFRIRQKNMEIHDMTNQILLISERLKNSTIEKNMLSRTIDEKDSQILSLTKKADICCEDNLSELKKQVVNVFLKDIKSLSSICNELNCCADDANHILLKKMKNELERMRSSKNMKLVENLVDKFRDGLFSNASKELVDLDTRNLNLLCLLYSGLDQDMISVILGIRYNSFGPTKIRLKAKIMKSKSNNAKFYLDSICSA